MQNVDVYIADGSDLVARRKRKMLCQTADIQDCWLVYWLHQFIAPDGFYALRRRPGPLPPDK